MLDELVKQINSTFGPEKIILFGSHAWGTPNCDSDYDLFIIMESEEKRYSKRAIEILKECHPVDFSIDLLVRTPNEVNEHLEMGDPFIKKIITKGKVLYDASRR